MTKRLEQITKMLQATPSDAFLLYGAALELKKSGEFAESVAYLGPDDRGRPEYELRVLPKGPSARRNRRYRSGRRAYRAGLVAANRIGDAKAIGELSQALSIVE